MKVTHLHAPLLLAVAVLTPLSARAGQPLETESARLLPLGKWQVESAFEFQTSSQGKEYATPLAIEYGITDQIQLLVEPVFYTAIRPKGGSGASGLGDLEISLFGQIFQETDYLPAIAIAGEIKIPTARNVQIGTKKTDYTPFIVMSKKFGKLDVSANFGYSFVGQPSGVKLKNTFNYALGAEYALDDQWTVVAEVLYTSSGVAGNSTTIGTGIGDGGDTPVATEGTGGNVATDGENSTTPEAAGKELIGTVGVRYKMNDTTSFSFGVSYDNNDALLLRPGVSFSF